MDALKFEETAPDGQVFESVIGGGAASVRLFVQLESLTNRRLWVAVCRQGLAIVPEEAPRPYCQDGSDVPWIVVPPGGTVEIFPLIDRPPGFGVFTASLLPLASHSSYVDWPDYVPVPVTYELTREGCRVTP